MKKIYSMLFVAGMMALTACGGSKEEGNNETTTTSEEVVAEETTETQEPAEPAEPAKYGDWTPEGTYAMVDGEGVNYTLVIKEGGKAELINEWYKENYPNDYTPIEGKWHQSGGAGNEVSLNFWTGPFITIGDASHMMSGVLTPDRLYEGVKADESNTNYIAVTKK